MRRFVKVPKKDQNGTGSHAVVLQINSSDGCRIRSSYTLTDDQCYQLGAIMATWASANAKAGQ